MLSMLRPLAAVALAVVAAASVARSKTAFTKPIHVCPDGSTNAGRASSASNAGAASLATLHAAQLAARHAIRALDATGMPGQVEVVLCGGVHRLLSPLEFEAADSPRHPESRVVWRGAGLTEPMPVISGGVTITGWAAVPGASPPVFKALLPPAEGNFVRLLWSVSSDMHDEQSRVRLPRLTAEGVPSSCGGGGSSKYIDSSDISLPRAKDAPAVGCREVTLPSSEVIHFDPIGSFGKLHRGYVANSSAPLHWRNIGDVEFVFTHSGNPWTESRCTVASVTANGTCAHSTGACTAILLKEPCWSSAIGASGPDFDALLPNRIEQVMPVGAVPTLTPALAEGHFYADRAAAALYYWPTAGDDGLPPLWTVGRNVSTLLRGAADVRGHTFSGIQFELGGTWDGPNTDQGMVGYQAAYHNNCCGDTWGAGFHCIMWHNQTHDCWKMLAPVPAAIHFQRAQSVIFQDCSFHHMGTGAVFFDEGSQHCLVDRCTFGDVSGAAVMFGGIKDFGETDAARQTHGNVLHNSTISSVAVEYHGSAGVLVGWATSTVISHNEISNLSYSGISLGWGWGQASYQGNNSVHHNNIHHVMCGDLIDGGPIYTLGPQPNSSLHHNWLHHICNRYGLLYHDSGSEGFSDYANVCSDSPTLWWILINGNGDSNDVSGNFIDASCKTTYASCAKGDAPSHCNSWPNPLSTPSNCSANNCSCHCSVHSNIFVATPSDFPAEAKAIMADAGPTVWAPPTSPWSVEFSPPVILHGAFKVPKDPTMPGLPPNFTLDGNQSMVDCFHALNRSHLFGMYEIAYQHADRPIVESTDGGNTWEAAGSAVCHPVNNDGGKPCFLEQTLARQPDGSLRSLGDMLPQKRTGGITGFGSSGFTSFSQGHDGRLAIDYSHAKTSPVMFEGLPRPIPNDTKCFEGPGYDFPFASVFLPDGSTLMASPVCYGDIKTTYDKTISASSLVAWRSIDRSSYEYVGTIVAAKDAVPKMSTRGVTQEIDMALMADGVTVMVVIRIDGDGRCGMDDGGGPYRPYYASYSSDRGSTWSLAVPLAGTGCARPRLLSLGKAKPMILSGGRLCTEHMTGLFMWLNLAGTREGAWERYSLSYQHNMHWKGDQSYKFDERVNSSDIFESQAYTSLMQVDDTSFVVTYNKYWPKLFNGEDGCQGSDPLKIGCSSGFAMKVTLRRAP